MTYQEIIKGLRVNIDCIKNKVGFLGDEPITSNEVELKTSKIAINRIKDAIDALETIQLEGFVK